MIAARNLNTSRAAVLNGEIGISVHHRSAWARVARIWAELVEASEQSSFFVSEAWIETWLEIFGPRLDPSILIFEIGGQPVGTCLLVRAKSRLAGVPIKRILLNASGEAAADTTYSEFNDLLCRSGWDAPVAKALGMYLCAQDGDEIALERFSDGASYQTLRKVFDKLDLEEVWHPSYYVDLAALRASGMSYESVLGRTHRKHLRQNIRYHSELGDLRLECAGDLPTALSMLDELAELSQRRWESQGRRGVFSSPRFVAFHRALVTKCHPRGEVQMLRLTVGQETVGLVYNLIHRGKVYFYQCGYRYSEDRRLSPGILTLSRAIQYCLEAGFDHYDFLSGDTQYKRDLSTGSRQLVWATFRRPGPKLRLLKTLRRYKSFGCITGLLRVVRGNARVQD
jgi:hypothetical protein